MIYPAVHLRKFPRVRSTHKLARIKWYAESGFIGFYGHVGNDYLLTLGIAW